MMAVPPTSEVGHWLAGMALMLSFAVLAARRPGSVLGAYAAQATVLALAAGWQAWLQASPQLAVAALVTFGAKGVGLPLLLRRAFRGMRLAAGGRVPVALGAGLAGLAAAAVPEDLAPSLAMVLLGLLTMVARRGGAWRTMGLLSLENGAALALFGAVGLSAVLPLALASLGVVGVVAAPLAPARARAA